MVEWVTSGGNSGNLVSLASFPLVYDRDSISWLSLSSPVCPLYLLRVQYCEESFLRSQWQSGRFSLSGRRSEEAGAGRGNARRCPGPTNIR